MRWGPTRYLSRIGSAKGQHANCDACVNFKVQLRRAKDPRERWKVMEAYMRHLLDNTLDRQVDSNYVSMSMSLRSMLAGGHLLLDMSTSSSLVAMYVDGMDQAKFRTPRNTTTATYVDDDYTPYATWRLRDATTDVGHYAIRGQYDTNAATYVDDNYTPYATRRPRDAPTPRNAGGANAETNASQLAD